MNQMSLVSICKEYGLSRRAIQGYEKAGLVGPTSKTNKGYLVYDEKAIHRILFIKYCQNIGFKVKQISEFINEPKEIIKEKIINQISILETDLKRTKKLINDSKRIIDLLGKDNCDEAIFKITRKKNI